MDIGFTVVTGGLLLALLGMEAHERNQTKKANKDIVIRKYTPESHKHIAIDYDGTIVEDGAYPHIGEPLPGAIETMDAMLEEGYEIVIWTCRGGKHEAVDFIQEEEIKKQLSGLFKNHAQLAVNENFKYFLNRYTVGSPKISADVYIDNTSYGLEEVDWRQIYRDFIGKAPNF